MRFPYGWLRRGVKDPTAELQAEIQADPESDGLGERVIEQEREGVERVRQGFLND